MINLILVYVNDLPYLVEKDGTQCHLLKIRSGNIDDTNNALVSILNWFTPNNSWLNAMKRKLYQM